MSQKRAQLPDIYKQRKRICLGPSKTSFASNEHSEEENLKPNELISDAKAVLLFLRGLFPKEKFDCLLPPMILKHQVYSFIRNKTAADKQLNDLCAAGEIKLFKLPMGAGDNEYCVLFMDNYLSHVKDFSRISKKVVDKFIRKVAMTYKDVSISKEILCDDLHFKDGEITVLLRLGLLTFRDVGSWWLSIPNAGSFMKCFIRGRKSILMMIRKSKYREILQQELEQKKWPKLAKLGLPYHIHDVIGAGLVTCIQTTSGQVLRLQEG